MPKIPVLKSREVVAMLQATGFVEVGQVLTSSSASLERLRQVLGT